LYLGIADWKTKYSVPNNSSDSNDFAVIATYIATALQSSYQDSNSINTSHFKEEKLLPVIFASVLLLTSFFFVMVYISFRTMMSCGTA
jgi:hypothetical protein